MYFAIGCMAMFQISFTDTPLQRQTVISQFFQLDKLVVEGGKTVSSEVD